MKVFARKKDANDYTEGYVAHCKENLNDGAEECLKVFVCKKDALLWIEKIANGFVGRNCEFSLFELGKKVELIEYAEEVSQPSVVKRRFV